MDPISLGIGGLAVATLGGIVTLLVKVLAAKKDGTSQTTTVFQGATDTGGHQLPWLKALQEQVGVLSKRIDSQDERQQKRIDEQGERFEKKLGDMADEVRAVKRGQMETNDMLREIVDRFKDIDDSIDELQKAAGVK